MSKENTHYEDPEAGAKVKQRILPDGSLVCMPKAYAHRDDLPDTPHAKSVVVGMLDCQRATLLDEVSGIPQVTGRYNRGGKYRYCIGCRSAHIGRNVLRNVDSGCSE